MITLRKSTFSVIFVLLQKVAILKDSIYTGREVPDGGFGKKKDRSTLIAIIVGAIILLWALPQILSAIKQDAQPTGNQQSPQVQADAQGVLHEKRTGNIHITTEDCFISADKKKITVQSNIDNGTNKTVYNIEITYILLNENNEEIAKKSVTLPNELSSGEVTSHTEIIDVPLEYIGKQVSLSSSVHCNVRS